MKQCNFCKGISFYGPNYDSDPNIIVSFDERDNSLFIQSPPEDINIKIKYCPICGRRLSDE